MHQHQSHRGITSQAATGITRVEVLIVFGVCTMLMALIPPAILAAREAARHTASRETLNHWSISLAYSRSSAEKPWGNAGYLPPVPPFLPEWETDLNQINRTAGVFLFVIAAIITALLVKLFIKLMNRLDEEPFQPNDYRRNV